MSKPKTAYQCRACAAMSSKWVGQCPDCGAWNTLEEVAAGPTAGGKSRFSGHAGHNHPQALGEIEVSAETRAPTGIAELDRVLGGGIVDGSVILVGGDPGIGKSTLLLQALAAVKNVNALYVSGEESAQQIAARAQRLELRAAIREHKPGLLTETCVERVIATAQKTSPRLVVVDSIQTLYTEELQSAPGSVAQVRDCAAQLVRYAKQSDTTIFLVGHVTKEGALAGPRVLEHMVDTVLYFEGDSGGRYRVLRAVKNRFGAVNELGVFAMSDKGLKGVSNPSAIFLSRHDEPVAGSIVMVAREGTRPLLVEIQALVDESPLANPRRTAVGLEQNRLAMLLAVLHRHGGLTLFGHDVFVNAVGGVRVSETAADLPVVLAVMSSLRDQPLAADMVAFGELGLAGEIRPVPNGQERLQEAAKRGFKRAIIPKANKPRSGSSKIEIIPAQRLSDVLARL
ncbi:MAG: DNA repair protein RadA [Gammaproteobacteria bacterium]